MWLRFDVFNLPDGRINIWGKGAEWSPTRYIGAAEVDTADVGRQDAGQASRRGP